MVTIVFHSRTDEASPADAAVPTTAAHSNDAAVTDWAEEVEKENREANEGEEEKASLLSPAVTVVVTEPEAEKKMGSHWGCAKVLNYALAVAVVVVALGLVLWQLLVHCVMPAGAHD